MKTVHEVSEISNVSVRTLHYYDEIGLLKPTEVNESGYRLYDENALKRLYTILLFKELDFSLKEIKEILDSEGFDINAAVKDHLKILKLQKEHIENLIIESEKLLKGENVNIIAFDRSKMDKYKNEVKEKWGNTKEYKESAEKMKNKTKKEIDEINEGLMNIFASLGKNKHLDPRDKEVQKGISDLKNYITNNYYNCSNEMLVSLGTMYIEDERFRKNIDKKAGEGTAMLVNEAIKIFVEEK